jgi:hypothetical protein
MNRDIFLQSCGVLIHVSYTAGGLTKEERNPLDAPGS